MTGGPGRGDEVIADVHHYKAMYTLIQEHQTDVHSSVVDCAIPASEAFR